VMCDKRMVGSPSTNGWDLWPQTLHAPRICMFKHSCKAAYCYIRYCRRYCHLKLWGSVENRIFNELVSGHKKLHASSLHIQETTDELSKRLVKNWMRYSSSKIFENENMRKSRAAQSREKDSKLFLSTRIIAKY